MPQTGPDLVGAGYPISRPLLALLGGTGNATMPNVPVKTNLDFGLGNLVDASFASPAGSVYTVAVPVLPGDVITKMSLLCGATSAASANVTNLWAALYTGTGSAPGTAGVSPTLIASGQLGSAAGSVNIAPSAAATFVFPSTTITQSQAPFGYVYASFSITTGSAAVSFLSMTCPAAAQYQWFATSPFSFYLTSNGGTLASVPATIGTATRAANPPIVLLY